jgi:hypothetical protein
VDIVKYPSISILIFYTIIEIRYMSIKSIYNRSMSDQHDMKGIQTLEYRDMLEVKYYEPGKYYNGMSLCKLRSDGDNTARLTSIISRDDNKDVADYILAQTYRALYYKGIKKVCTDNFPDDHEYNKPAYFAFLSKIGFKQQLPTWWFGKNKYCADIPNTQGELFVFNNGLKLYMNSTKK